MSNNVNSKTTNVKHDYSNRTSCNGIPAGPNESLVPILLTWETVKYFYLDEEALETWNFASIPVLVGFAPVESSRKEANIKEFWRSVREYIADLTEEPGLSYDELLEKMESDDSRGFDPGATEPLEATVLVRLMIDEVIEKVSAVDPISGEILEMLKADLPTKTIFEKLGIQKSQGYSKIKKAQALARKFRDE